MPKNWLFTGTVPPRKFKVKCPGSSHATCYLELVSSTNLLNNFFNAFENDYKNWTHWIFDLWFLIVSATPPASQLYSSYSQGSNGLGLSQSAAQSSGLSKYAQLLAVIEEMGRDIRPTYAMGRGDRLKRLIIQAKVNILPLPHSKSLRVN